MMYTDHAFFPYGETEDVQILELPYRGGGDGKGMFDGDLVAEGEGWVGQARLFLPDPTQGHAEDSVRGTSGEALKRLAEQDPQSAEIVKVRFFVGLTPPERGWRVFFCLAAAGRYAPADPCM